MTKTFFQAITNAIYIMKKTAILILVILSVLISGCNKKELGQNRTGSITGKIDPARAAYVVAAVSVPGKKMTLAKPEASGVFNLSGLEAGVYKIGFVTDTLYIAPDSILVTVVAGQNADIGTIAIKLFSTGSLGGITGKVTPAKGAAGIVATAVTGTQRYSAVPDTAGNFRISSVVPGAYTVSFTTAPGYIPPADVSATVTAGRNTDIGSRAFYPAAYSAKTIDTISEPVNLGTVQAVNDFVNRANMDSAIVLLGNLTINLPSISTELASGLNKITAIRFLWMYSITNTSLSFNSLTGLNSLIISNAANLTSVDLPALKTFTGILNNAASISIASCPALQNVNLPALSEFAGSLSLNGTGFKDLSFFNKIKFTPFAIGVQNNKQLTTLRGLNLMSDSLSGCTITANPLLTSLDGLQGIKRMSGETVITNNPVLQSLAGLDNIVFANHFTLTGNTQLSLVCPAKQVINFVKDAPDYVVYQTNGLGDLVRVTKQALTASGNGVYATRADLLAAVAKCP